jgi:glycosyltransferase involved in cell wall biosynthesis
MVGRSILHLIDSLDPAAGGPVEFVKAISREHAAMGHHVDAALLTRMVGPAPEALEIVSAGESAKPGGYGYRTGLVAWLRQEAPHYDAIFVHGLWQYNGAAAWLALSPRDTPYYVFPHGMLDLWAAPDWRKDLKKRVYWEAIQKRIMRKARAVLFTSSAEMARAPRSFGTPWRAQELVELGSAEPPPDAEVQRAAFLGRFPDLRGRRIVLFLGRIHRKKGCDLLAQAFASTNSAGLELVMAGPCEDPAYRAELEKACPRIHFTGTLDGPVKWGAFRCAEVFVLPSHQENFGIAVAEALACGVPTLISTAVDIHQTVTDAGAGFADSDDLPGTQRLLEKWLSLDPATQEQMRAAAVRCFHEHLHIRKTAERLISLLDTPPSKSA